MSLRAQIKEKRKSWGGPGLKGEKPKLGGFDSLSPGSNLSLIPKSLSAHAMNDNFWGLPTKKQVEYSATEQAFLTALASYVPGIVARHFRLGDQPLTLPFTQTWPSCILFADISGFTPLTESLAAQGKRGIELLTEHLNDYFGKMINLIVSHGGDVVKFAGDALLSIFPAPEESQLASVALLACQCALQLQKQLGKYEANGVCLTLHIGVSSGLVSGVHVGGVREKVEFILAGAPLDHVGDCEKAADSGEVYISHHTASLVAHHVDLSVKVTHEHFPQKVLAKELERRKGSSHVGRFLAERVPTPRQKIKIQRVKSLQEQPHDIYRLDRMGGEVPLIPIPPYGTQFFANMEKYLSPYVQSVVLEHIKSGAPDSFLTQLRRVSVIFVMLDLAYSDKALNKIQEAMCEMQTAIYHYDGTVRQFIIDDKGSVFIAVFGLPPLAHEDDPSRAVQASTMLQRSLAALEIGTSIGITTGDVFSGAVGCPSRREYAAVGDLVNLSARLMVAAKGLILVDSQTQQSCPELSFKDLGKITVKGKTVPIQIYTPLKKRVLKSEASVHTVEVPVVGREEEMKVFFQAMERLQKLKQRKKSSSHEKLSNKKPRAKIQAKRDSSDVKKKPDIKIIDADGPGVSISVPGEDGTPKTPRSRRRKQSLENKKDTLVLTETCEVDSDSFGDCSVSPRSKSKKDDASPEPKRREARKSGPRTPTEEKQRPIDKLKIQERKILDNSETSSEDSKSEGLEPKVSIPTTILIEGPAGIGKTHIINKFKEMVATHTDLNPLVGCAFSVEKSTAYFTWRSIFEEILLGTTRVNREDVILASVSNFAPKFIDYLPLLNPVLQEEFSDNEITSRLTGHPRALKTNQFLLTLLKNSGHAVIFLDNAQWIDSSSLELATRVSVELKNILLVIAFRSDDELPFPTTSFSNSDTYKHIQLLPFTTQEITAFACHKFSVEKLGTKTVPFLQNICQGNPFMLSELLEQLQATGRIKIVGDKWADLRQESFMVSSGKEIRMENTTATLRTLITSKLDRLDQKLSIVLKFACVIGRVFPASILHSLLPDIPLDNLKQYLAELERQSIIVLHSKVPLSYEFFQMAINEVVYETMAYATRREIHGKVAHWYQDNTPIAQHATIFPLLAHHFRLAEEKEEAVRYLWAAGEQALDDCHFKEAAKFFYRILTLTESKKPSGTAPGEIATWKQIHLRRCLGQCLHALGQNMHAKTFFSEALELIGSPVSITQNKLLMKEVSTSKKFQGINPLEVVKVVEEPDDLGLFKKTSLEDFSINLKQLPLKHHVFARTEPEEYFDSYSFTKEHFYVLSSLSRLFDLECQLEQRTYCVMKALQLALTFNSMEDLCIASAETGLAFAIQKETILAQKMFSNANFLAGKLVEAPVEGTLALQKGIYNIITGQWALALQHLKQADCFFLTCGDVRKSDETNLSIAFIQLLQGQPEEAYYTSSRISISAYKRQDNQFFLLSLSIKALNSRLAADSMKLIDTVKNVEDLDLISRITMLALIAQNSAQNNRIQDSYNTLETILALFDKIDPSSYWLWLSASLIPSIYETLLATKPAGSPGNVSNEELSKKQKIIKDLKELKDLKDLNLKDLKDLKERSNDLGTKLELGFRQSLAFLQKFAGMFPFAESRVFYYRAVASIYEQKPKHAENLFKQSIAFATKYDVPGEAALSQERLAAKNLTPEVPARELRSRMTLLDQTM